MRRSYLLPLLILFLLTTVQTAVGQSNINPSSVDVNNLSDAQIKKIMQEMQTRGLTQDQAIALAKAQGASQTQIDQLQIRIQQQQMNPSDTLSTSTADFVSSNSSKKTYTSPKARIFVSEKT